MTENILDELFWTSGLGSSHQAAFRSGRGAAVVAPLLLRGSEIERRMRKRKDKAARPLIGLRDDDLTAAINGLQALGKSIHES
ncbi:MAG TPA: hypothetical protein VFQ90_00105, partial [Stellaceae bacterium]|nr:hypothetical protein [Stellaceae bacterium]